MGLLKRLLVGTRSEPAQTASALPRPDLPAPPTGFTRHWFSPANLAVLCPEGWFVHEVNSERSFTGCVSKESIPAEGHFKTGLTVRVFPGLNQGFGDDDPEVVIITVVQRLYGGFFQDPTNEILYADPLVMRTATSRLLRMRVRQSLPGTPPIIIQKFLITVSQGPDLYDFTFESPEALWEESWKLGHAMLGNLLFGIDSTTTLAFSADPPLPADDLIVQKTLEVGQALGWSLKHENREEGLFVWRFAIEVREAKGSRVLGGHFAWYMKRVQNEIWVDDPVLFDMTVSGSMGFMEQMGAAARRVQEDFKRRWLSAIGPVTLRGANPETHSADLVMEVMTALSQGKPPQ